MVEYIVQIAGLVTALAVIYRFVVRPTWRWLVSLRELNASVSKILDNTDRMSESMQVTEARTLAMQDLSDKAIFECAPDGRCTFVNWELHQLFGMGVSQMLEHGWTSAIDANERPRVWEHWQKCIESELSYEAEYNITNQATGKRYRIKAQANPMYSGRNGTRHIVGWHGACEIIQELDD